MGDVVAPQVLSEAGGCAEPTGSSDQAGEAATPARMLMRFKAQMKCSDSTFSHRIAGRRRKRVQLQRAEITQVSNREEESNQQPFVTSGRREEPPPAVKSRLTTDQLIRPSPLARQTHVGAPPPRGHPLFPLHLGGSEGLRRSGRFQKILVLLLSSNHSKCTDGTFVRFN